MIKVAILSNEWLVSQLSERSRWAAPAELITIKEAQHQLDSLILLYWTYAYLTRTALLHQSIEVHRSFLQSTPTERPVVALTTGILWLPWLFICKLEPGKRRWETDPLGPALSQRGPAVATEPCLCWKVRKVSAVEWLGRFDILGSNQVTRVAIFRSTETKIVPLAIQSRTTSPYSKYRRTVPRTTPRAYSPFRYDCVGLFFQMCRRF